MAGVDMFIPCITDLHCPGSTGLPKPIYQRQNAALANFALNMDMKAFITLPLYHNHGISNFFRAIHSGKSIHIYNAELPLTSDYLCETLRQHRFQIFYGVPYALKLLAETDLGVELLRELEVVMYGGSACPDELGDLLVSRGVNLVSHYGATEVGQLMTSFRSPGDQAWNYVRETDKLAPYLRWIPRGPNLYECSVLEGWPSKVATNQPDGSYNTRDLFEPHATIAGAWKYIARLDDTLVLVNGEKFNPVQLEGRIRSHPSVREAVVFGAQQPFLGLLIIPSPATRGLPVEELETKLWTIVNDATQSVDAFARIPRNMIIILPHDVDFPCTDKGSIIRQAFYKRFSAEIQEAYDRADTSSSDSKAMTLAELNEFLRGALSRVMATDVSLSDDEDFFALGMDSLQAIQLRSEILRSVDVGGHKVGQNIVFDHPTLDKLCRYLLSLRTGVDTKPDVSVEEDMQRLVEAHSIFTPPQPIPRTSVAVTGATGSLGAHIVCRLAHDPSLERIYCLVRAPDRPRALQRVKESLVQRRIYHTLPLVCRSKLVAIPFDQSDALLGLDKATYRAIASDLRSVIHCAWSVNFNMQLSSFESSCIAGVHNLIDLCRAYEPKSPATFNFCSSVSTVARAPMQHVPESLPEHSWAQAMGYAQSKSVAEHICIRATEHTGVPARVLRVGQIVADTQHGVWNATEAIPLLMQSALTIGALPRLQETTAWLPVDTVAEAVVDISLSDAPSLVVNVVNHKTCSWTEDILPALRDAGLEFEEVEPKEWVRKLRQSNPDPNLNPPVKLVDFFASKYDRESGDFRPSKTLVTDTARRLSPELAKAKGLDRGMVTKFVRYFTLTAWKPHSSSPLAKQDKKLFLVVAGPCGSGKTTVGKLLAARVGAHFIEGDLLHSREAVAKMSSGYSLTDEDRRAWLDRLAAGASKALCELSYDAVVASCSALKREYREQLRQLSSSSRNGKSIQVLFLDLQAREHVLMHRVGARQGHYMPVSQVSAQAKMHEEVGVDEIDVFPINAEESVEQVVEEALWGISKIG